MRISLLLIDVAGGFLCPLQHSRKDELLTVQYQPDPGKILNLIIDTGSAGTILFDHSANGLGDTVGSVAFQGYRIGLVHSHNRGSLICQGSNLDITRPDVTTGFNSGLDSVADGIVGLGQRALQRALGDEGALPFLFSESAPAWSSIYICQNDIRFVSGQHFRRPFNYFPLVSQYYWATSIASLLVGSNELVTSSTAVVFDTGSNFFGFSPTLFVDVTRDLFNNSCKDDLVLNIHGQEVKFSPAEYLVEDNCGDFAIGEIDPSPLGDLSRSEVMIVGTRGLRIHEFGIHKGTSSRNDVLSISFNYSKIVLRSQLRFPD